MMVQMHAVKEDAKAFPLNGWKGDPFSKGFPSGSLEGWKPFCKAWKLQLNHFHKAGQVSFVVATFGKTPINR